MKKFLGFLVVFTLIFTIVGCAGQEDTADKDQEGSETELTDQAKAKMYNAIRVAEGKMNEVFHKETVSADDTTPVINSSFADEASAVAFLSKYYGEEVSKEMYTHYATDKTTDDGRMLINEESFFKTSILETTQADVTIEGDVNKANVKTSDVTYQVELVDEKYIVTGVQQ